MVEIYEETFDAYVFEANLQNFFYSERSFELQRFQIALQITKKHDKRQKTS